MALCSAEDVKAYFEPVSLTDTDISKIIDLITGDLVDNYGVSATDTNGNIKRTCIHLSVAATMRKAKTTGELNQSVRKGEYSQQNNYDADIAYHEAQAEKYLAKFTIPEFGLIAGRTGVNGVDYEP